MSTKKVNKVSVLLPPEEFERFSHYCEKHGYKKTSLIQRLIRTHLDSEDFHTQPSFAFDNVSKYGTRRS